MTLKNQNLVEFLFYLVTLHIEATWLAGIREKQEITAVRVKFYEIRIRLDALRLEVWMVLLENAHSDWLKGERKERENHLNILFCNFLRAYFTTNYYCNTCTSYINVIFTFQTWTRRLQEQFCLQCFSLSYHTAQTD